MKQPAGDHLTELMPRLTARGTSTQASVPVVRATRALTAEAVWAQLRSRPAAERPALMRGYLQQLAPREVARLLELSEAGARHDVLKRLARPEGLCQR